MRSSRSIGCSPIRRSTSTIFWCAGSRSSSAHGTPSWWLWTGPISMQTNRPLSCWRSLPITAAQRLCLADRRQEHAQGPPAGLKVCIVADRGFGDQKLYKMLTEELYFDYVIRFRGNIAVTAAGGETRSAA